MNPNQLTVAAIQMTSTDSVEENLQTADQLIQAAKKAGADVMVLPEYFCLMGHTDQDKVTIKENFGQGRMQDSLSLMPNACVKASQLLIWLQNHIRGIELF